MGVKGDQEYETFTSTGKNRSLRYMQAAVIVVIVIKSKTHAMCVRVDGRGTVPEGHLDRQAGPIARARRKGRPWGPRLPAVGGPDALCLSLASPRSERS